MSGITSLSNVAVESIFSPFSAGYPVGFAVENRNLLDILSMEIQ